MSDIHQFLVQIDQFKIIKNISLGGLVKNYLIEDQKSQQFAAKVILIFNDNQDFDFEGMISFLGNFRHPTLVNFIGYSPIDFNGDNHFTIITEYYPNHSLYDFLKNNSKNNTITNTDIQIILIGICRGMYFLHKNNRIHRDLKDTNVLIDNNGHPHITGFTPSAYLEEGQKLDAKIGTPLYMAPEVIKGEYDFSADVYSFAILMNKILTGKESIGEEKHAYRHMQQVLDGCRPVIDQPIKKSFRVVIEKCWSEDTDERLTFEELFNKFAYDKEYRLDDVDEAKIQSYVESIK